MFRFGTKTMLFVFILVAAWCSTFSGYAAGRDVRASVLLVVFLAAGYSALYSHGKARAFWVGFFAVMLLAGGNFFQGPVNKYVPNFIWWNQNRNAMSVVYSSPPSVYVQPTPLQPVQPYATPTQPPPAYATAVAVAPAPITDYAFQLAVSESVAAIWTLTLAAIVGLVGMWIFTTRRAQDT
jgi:hypothetical protein